MATSQRELFYRRDLTVCLDTIARAYRELITLCDGVLHTLNALYKY